MSKASTYTCRAFWEKQMHKAIAEIISYLLDNYCCSEFKICFSHLKGVRLTLFSIGREDTVIRV